MGEVGADSPVYDDNVNPLEVLTPDDLLSFAWQVASGMVIVLNFYLVHFSANKQYSCIFCIRFHVCTV